MLMFEQLKSFIYMHSLCAQMFSAIRGDYGSGAQEQAGSSVLDSYCKLERHWLEFDPDCRALGAFPR